MVKEITQKDFKLLEDRFNKLEIQYKEEIKQLKNEIKDINKHKKLKKKDPNAPKKYKSAYIFFNIERINEHKNNFPNQKINVANIAKDSGKEWNKIKEDEKKYEKYKKMEESDKKRYKNEIDIYEKTNMSQLRSHV
jgi:hypothetical protein